MLELCNLTKVYKTKSEDVVALNKINLSFGETGMVFVTGKSGSGKTTLLNVVGGLDSFDDGDIVIKGKSFARFNQQDFDNYRNTFIGFVFQEYNLLDEMRVEKNISLAMELQGSKKRDVDRINKILKQVDLEGLNGRLPNELSGGQKQRVAIARALVKEPKIILTDEPTGALDTNSGIQVMNLLKELSRDRLVIIVSHNTDLARAYADRIIEMKDGNVDRDYTLKRGSDTKKLNIKEFDEKVLVKRGVKLSDKDLTLLQKAVEQGKDVQIVDDDNFYEEKETERIDVKQYAEGDAQFIKGRLGFGNTLKLGLSNLKIKPVRLAVTIILCAIAFSVFGLFDAMTIYDEARLTANTLKNSNVPSIVLTSSMQESNGDEYKMGLNEQAVNALRGDTGLNFKGVYSISSQRPYETKNASNISKYYTTSILSGVVEIDGETELSELGFRVAAGRLPAAYDEIAVSSYYAMCLVNYAYTCGGFVADADTKPQDLIQDEPLYLTLNDVRYNIVGIIDVGDIDSQYDVLLDDYASYAKSTLEMDFKNYVSNSFNLYGFVKKGFVADAYARDRNLIQYKNPSYHYDFEFANNDVQYFLKYDDLVNMGKNYYGNANYVYFIDEGKTTLNDYEVLINVQLFESCYGNIIDKCLKVASDRDKEQFEYLLPRLKTTQTTPEEKMAAVSEIVERICGTGRYKTAREDFIFDTKVEKSDTTRYESNTSSELAKVELQHDTYKIVGFYTGVALTTNVNALVLSETGISNLGVSLQQGAYSSVIAPSTRSSAQINKIVNLVKRSSGLKFASSNNVINMITLNQDALQDVSTLFLIASAVFAVFAIAMMANYISTSITNRHEQIGILRALGTTGGGVLLMFLAESVIIALINVALSNAITAVGCMLLNMFFTNVIHISIPLASYTIRQFWVIFGLSIAVAFVSSFAPILKLSRKKPIETIRR
ncbi:MAG: ATP-binding cassette domain-containing protein [Corallococcus sp.]|nr:ATP-binding cassette domain-containing protein [Corallococcus sp.]